MLVLLVLAALVFAGGCRSEKAEVVAEVNGIKLTRDQLDQRVQQYKTMFELQGFQFDGEEGREILALLERESLNQLIMETVLQEEAKKHNIAVSAEEVQASYEEMMAPYGEAVFKEILRQQNVTEKQLKKDIELMLLQDRLFEKITAGVTVGEDQVKEYYEAHKEDLVQYRASHILIRPDQEAEDQEEANRQAKAKAEALIKELNRGADFAELAKEHSADGSAANGGDLGQYFTRAESPYVSEFTEAAVSLGVGEYTRQPVETVFGYHIVKLTDKKESFEELKDDLQARLEKEEKNKVFDEYFTQAMEEAKIINYLEQNSPEE